MADLEDFRSSMVRFCSNFASEMKAAGVADLQVVDFDAHADMDSLPSSDIIGPSGFSLTSDEGNHEIDCRFGISTFEDVNNFRLYRMLNRLYKLLEPDSMIPIYDAETGQQLGVAKLMNGTRLLGVAKTKLRPLAFIQTSMVTPEA